MSGIRSGPVRAAFLAFGLGSVLSSVGCSSGSGNAPIAPDAIARQSKEMEESAQANDQASKNAKNAKGTTPLMGP